MPELKSTVKSKPNARVSLPGNRRIKKGGNIQFLPFPLSLSHLAQFRSAGFLLRIWASTDGSKPFCLFNNCENYVWANWGCFWYPVSVHCEASEWSPWSPCTKKGKTCGFKRGTETRVREIIQHPSAKGNLCPPTSESRKCTVQRKKCPKGERGTVILTTCARLDPHDLMQISLFLRKHLVWSLMSKNI